MRAAFSGKVDEIALAAGAAAFARRRGGDLSECVDPHIVGKKGAADAVSRADDDLHRFGGSDGGDHIDG